METGGTKIEKVNDSILRIWKPKFNYIPRYVKYR